MSDFDAQSYKDFLRQALQSEENYWTYVDQILPQLLVSKEKEKYQPTLDIINDILKNDKEKGSVKLLALRLLGACILPTQNSQDSLPVNKDLVTKLLKSKSLLETLQTICAYRIDVPDENRGQTMFKDEGREIGQEFLLCTMEFIKTLALTWEKTVSKSGEQVPTQFNLIYHNLVENGATFPEQNNYFDEPKKKKGTSKTQSTAPAPAATQKPPQPSQQQPQEPDLAQLARDSFFQTEVLLTTVYEREQIEEFVQEVIENSEGPSLEMLQQITNVIDRMPDDTSAQDQEAILKAFEYYRHLTTTIPQLRQKQYVQKTYGVFRKKLLAEAEKSYPGLWNPPAPQEAPKQAAPQPAANDWGANDFGGNNNKFDFNEGGTKTANDGFGGGFGDFNFDEQRRIDEQEEQERLRQQKQQEKERQAKQQQQQNDFDREQFELDQQMAKANNNNNNNNNGFNDDFGNNFGSGFGGFSGFGQQPAPAPSDGFGTFQEHPHQPNKQQPAKQQDNQRFDDFTDTRKHTQDSQRDRGFNQGFDHEFNQPQQQQKGRESPKFSQSEQQQYQYQDSVKQTQQQQQQQQSQFNEKKPPKQQQQQQQSQFQPPRPQQKDTSNSYSYMMKSQNDNFQGSFRDSFVDFSDLSKSDISVRDFPLRNSVINSKEIRGRFHAFSREAFQVLQEYNLTQQVVRRFKIANLKKKCPLIESSDFQVGVLSERIFDQNSSRYLIKCDLFFGNKTLYPVQNFSIELEGDQTSHLFIKNDNFPEEIASKKQYKVSGLLSYSKTPYSLINANITGKINNQDISFTVFMPNLLPKYIHFLEPSNVMPFFRAKWHAKRDQIIKSDSFALNKRVIRSPVYFKKYFPQFQENMTLEEFIYENKNQANPVNYKLRGTVTLDIPSIEYMIKFIVRPNFTAVIQIIPFSGYVNTAETIIDHFVFIFGQQ